MSLASNAIYRNKFEKQTLHNTTVQTLILKKIVMYIQKLHHFCNTFFTDDGLKLGRKNLGNNKLWKVNQPIPAEYPKIDWPIRKA